MVRAVHRVAPVYWAVMSSTGEWSPTCVVAGPNRHRAWLYVHNPTPTVLRLHSEVVVFLLRVLNELSVGEVSGEWRLVKNTQASYPDCVVVRANGEAWLYVFGLTPSAVRLTPRVVDFLWDVLPQLPVVGEGKRAG